MSGHDALDELYERLRETEDARRAGEITPEAIRAARGGVVDGYGRECRETGENAADGDSEPLAGIPSDTRERIEADLLALTKSWHDHDGDFMKLYSSVAYAQVKELLDRQAALTESEWGSATANRRIAELQVKLDHAAGDAELYRANMMAQTERVAELQAELDELRPQRIVEFAEMESDEPPYDELLRCLENDWHISASWDGLRKFWNIELTEEGDDLRAKLAQCMESYADAKDSRDALRAELDEYGQTHMLLPVDADGVPIHVGDELIFTDHSGREFNVTVEPLTTWEPSMYRHVEPSDSWERICADLRAMDAGNLIALGNGNYVEDTRHDEIAARIERMAKA